MRRPLGCMTFSALVATILALLVIAVGIAVTGNTMFSPGPLNAEAQAAPGAALGGVTSHAGLEGRCDACHTSFWSGETMNQRCVACHDGVGRDIAAASGLHGRLGAVAPDCRACHTEHHGTAASLTNADPDVFPHDDTGFALAAHHASIVAGAVTCRSCHPGAPANHATTSCVRCHERLDAAMMAEHTAAYGTDCIACHDGKDTYGASFQHTTYPLVGGHESAACAGCHQGARTIAALRDTPTGCAACHAQDDVHDGRLGTSCESCHAPGAWTDATIDHARTRFALTGEHVEVDCASCHVDGRWTGIGTTCASCHAEDDPHAGRFGADCAACHAPTGWDDVAFDHAVTGFPLASGHAEVPCASCHLDDRYAGTPTACVACHAADDRHDSALGTDCARCHEATNWSAGRFDHGQVRFALTGAHLRPACERCHTKPPPSATPTQCAACHTKPETHTAAFSGACDACHTARAWTPAKFDHSRTGFRLTGAHAGLACAGCHKGTTYTGLATSCVSCHAKPASHPAAYGRDCTLCHTTRAWVPISYRGPHTFPVNHRGAGGTCATCHPSSLATYTCTKCHSASAMAEHHKEIAGYSATDCTKCHPQGTKEEGA